MITCPLICITGPDGSGKSTLIRLLQASLPGSVTVSIWDLLKEPSMQDVVPFKSPLQADAYLARLHPEGRSLFLMHCLLEAMETAKDRQPACILTDSYWYKYYATEAAHGASARYLDKLVSVFDKPDHLFYIRAGEELTAGRKQFFSGYECGFAEQRNETTFSRFQQKAIGVLQQLMQTQDYIELNAQATPAENHDIILQSLNPSRYANSDHYRH